MSLLCNIIDLTLMELKTVIIEEQAKSNNGFAWIAAPIGAPIEYAHSILHVNDHLPQ